MRGQIPEFPRWFLPCVRRWLEVYQKEAMSFVDNAWDDDRDNLEVRRVYLLMVSLVFLLGLFRGPLYSWDYGARGICGLKLTKL